jgi:cytochrome b561
MERTAPPRYDRIAVLLHWICALALLGQIGFGFLLGQFARNTPERALAINLHKSSGLLLALLILVRLLWRLRHAPPPYPAATTPRQLRLIRAGHGMLYACMLLMPLSGYLASNFSRHGIQFFNRIALPPWGPDDKAIYGLLNGVHDVTAFVFSALIALHVAAALFHAFVRRDAIPERMALASPAPRSAAAR